MFWGFPGEGQRGRDPTLSAVCVLLHCSSSDWKSQEKAKQPSPPSPGGHILLSKCSEFKAQVNGWWVLCLTGVVWSLHSAFVTSALSGEASDASLKPTLCGEMLGDSGITNWKWKHFPCIVCMSEGSRAHPHLSRAWEGNSF